MSVISVRGLHKDFGRAKALAGFDLEVHQGEIHGFLGPNGAGKSTTIRIILGLLRKSSGDVKLFGQDPWKNAVKLHEKLAYVPGDVNFWPNLTGGEIIDLLGNLRGGLDETRRKNLLEKFQLDPAKKFRTYSKGNRQKVALVAALANDVPLYILDEPTSGLDPLMEQVFQSEIHELKKQGKTILLSSHILSEAESLCDRATIIREGQTVGVYELRELKANEEDLEKIFLSKYEGEK
jgi:ABC-2 type transport system ATP-binding protein